LSQQTTTQLMYRFFLPGYTSAGLTDCLQGNSLRDDPSQSTPTPPYSGVFLYPKI